MREDEEDCGFWMKKRDCFGKSLAMTGDERLATRDEASAMTRDEASAMTRDEASAMTRDEASAMTGRKMKRKKIMEV